MPPRRLRPHEPRGKRLFVAALGNDTLEVIDVAADKRITSIGGLNEPQGVAYLPLLHRIVVAMRGGSVRGAVAPLADLSDGGADPTVGNDRLPPPPTGGW
jgi:YVTN family beta-propeller protein